MTTDMSIRMLFDILLTTITITIQNMNSQRGKELIMSAKTALSENILLFYNVFSAGSVYF